jgi:hypothetical protein
VNLIFSKLTPQSSRLFYYHDAFFTPGISPLIAISRKQILHTPNVLKNPRFLPHLKQRETARLENLGFFLLRAMTDAFAMIFDKTAMSS